MKSRTEQAQAEKLLDAEIYALRKLELPSRSLSLDGDHVLVNRTDCNSITPAEKEEFKRIVESLIK